jgi:hypothetical protein
VDAASENHQCARDSNEQDRCQLPLLWGRESAHGIKQHTTPSAVTPKARGIWLATMSTAAQW